MSLSQKRRRKERYLNYKNTKELLNALKQNQKQTGLESLDRLRHNRYSRNDSTEIRQESGTLPPISLNKRIIGFEAKQSLFNTISNRSNESPDRCSEDNKSIERDYLSGLKKNKPICMSYKEYAGKRYSVRKSTHVTLFPYKDLWSKEKFAFNTITNSMKEAITPAPNSNSNNSSITDEPPYDTFFKKKKGGIYIERGPMILRTLNISKPVKLSHNHH